MLADTGSDTKKNKMRTIDHLIKTLLILSLFQSCLVPLAPKTHYFSLVDSTEKSSPKLQIFSTPKYKSYVVTKVDMDAQVFIQSPIFENPNEFYLMKNEAFFGSEAKQYQLEKRDRKFYRMDDYKNARIKIIDATGERIVNYKTN